jgi:hypothetical protein
MPANMKQIGGEHYRSEIQHWDYVLANKLENHLVRAELWKTQLPSCTFQGATYKKKEIDTQKCNVN